MVVAPLTKSGPQNQARMTFQIILLMQFCYAKHDFQIYVYMIEENSFGGNRFCLLEEFALF